MTQLEKAKQFLESQSTGTLQERALYYVRKFPDSDLTKLIIEVLTDRGWEVPASL